MPGAWRGNRTILTFFGVLALAASGCARETLAHLQEEPAANRILGLLDKEGIQAAKVKDENSRDLRFNISVDKTDAGRAYEILIRHNLPSVAAPDSKDVFMNGGGMIPTNAQERAKKEVGMQGDIVNALKTVPSVIGVEALVSIPEDNPLRDVNEAKPRPKASVMIVYIPDVENRPPMTAEEVQNFVAGKINEIKPTEIAVQMIPLLHRGERVDDVGGEGGGSTSQVIPANSCEKEWVLGLGICKDYKKRLVNGLIGVVLVAGVLAAMAVLAVLRALRYRKDLTRLTAQFAQLKK